MTSGEHRFQVNLGGVIALLSDHLYAQPGVFLRELLQNATDAITARRHKEPGYEGGVVVELEAHDDGAPARLIVADTGIGLREDEIHCFLSTIGASSKRELLEAQRRDFIGQFGIGLLSCFILCDEVDVSTRSVAPNAPTLRWRGRRDGTYTLAPSDVELAEPGTRVCLTPRADARHELAEELLRTRLLHFGRHLTVPIWLAAGSRKERIDASPPWRLVYADETARRSAYLAYGEEQLDEHFVDAIPLRCAAGEVEGIGFVLSRSPHYNARQRHRVYVKGMLVSDACDNLLPSWAFFVRAVVNANGLELNASREALQENEQLEEAREGLGAALKAYWEDLARRRPQALQRLLELHDLSVRALALDDDDFFRLVAEALPFETSLGSMTLGQCLRVRSPLQFVTSLPEFRQMAPIAAAQSLCLVNAAYTYDADLLRRVPSLLGFDVEKFTIADLPHALLDLTLAERGDALRLLNAATAALETFGVVAEVKSFAPPDMPVLLSIGDDAHFLRSVERTKAKSDPLFAGLLDDVLETQRPQTAPPVVCFNYRNAVVRRLCHLEDAKVMARMVELLYAQAVLLSQRPLRSQELAILNRGLLGLIEAQLELSSLIN